MSGFAAVIVGIITVEVTIVVGELLEMRRKRLTANLRESRAEAEKLADELEKSRARADGFEAKYKELRQELKRNGSAEDAKQ